MFLLLKTNKQTNKSIRIVYPEQKYVFSKLGFVDFVQRELEEKLQKIKFTMNSYPFTISPFPFS